ncbi:MAG: glycosyltransferase [Cytophagales bacterium]|nr:glycosyltransferase [Cytophagales bacterium]
MKILHVIPSYYPATRYGGPIQSVHLLNKYLVKNGVQVDVATTNAGQNDDFDSNLYQTIDGVNVRYFNYTGYEHYNLSIPIFIYLKNNIRKYDLVHITAVWNFTVWAACHWCKYYGIKYIISPRGTIYEETINIKSSIIKKIYYLLIAKKCLHNAAYIHYTTQDEYDKVENYLHTGTTGVVIQNGIEINDIALEVPNNDVAGKNYILFLGRLNKKKGIEILLQAFADILPQYPDYKLIIAGPDNDDELPNLISIVKALGIQNHVNFVGEVKGMQKVLLYSHAACFVLSSYSENFGMSVVEAMMYGCPVVVSDRVGIHDVIQKYDAGIVTTLEVNDVASAIIKILKDDKLRTAIANNAKILLIDKFDIQSVATQMIEMYNSICTDKQ